MIISDINYLEVADKENNLVSGGSAIDFKYDKDVDIKKNIYIDIYKDVYSDVYVRGQLAEAQAVAKAYGYDTLSETHTATYADVYSTAAISESTSATNGAYYVKH
ncbi:MAG: hypothetical protein QNJ65_21335 [Xenococcaceae cyanobacterium MO_234.B1]|nr:hypothetical protein [Xenococcaceae cyanobacterium MO_234.B1]